MAFSEWFQSHSSSTVSFTAAQREWRDLQAGIQIARGRSRLALRLAPVNSLQYRLARRLLPRRSSLPGGDVSSEAAVAFVEPWASWESDVEVIRIDGRSAQELNTDIATSTKPWIFLAANSDSDDDIARLIWHLLGSAQEETAVYYSGDVDVSVSEGVGPHTLLSYNAVGRGAIMRRNAVLAVGGFDSNAADREHDLVLRLSEAGYNFVGLPAEHQLASAPTPTPDTTIAALRRRGVTGSVTTTRDTVAWSVMSRPTIDIVIPTRDRLDLLQTCISSIEENCGDFAVSITIVDNDSREPSTLDYFAVSPHRVVAHPGPFNYAEIVNHGVATGRNDVVVVLNNDTIVGPGWLDGLAPLATLADVGVVGATLVSPSGEVQHAGMAAVPYPIELPFGRVPHLLSHVVVPLSPRQSAAIRNVLAVTGACHVVERAKWNIVGGMDESLRVTANDVDLCLRLSARGYYTVLNPTVVIQHVGKASRGTVESEDDHIRFLQRWGFLRELVDPCVPRRRATLLHTGDLLTQ